MKIRNLILKVKLKQIETQYQYIFVFHCSSLRAPQWRHFKHLLYITQGNMLFQPSASAASTEKLFAHQFHSKLTTIPGPFCIVYSTHKTIGEVHANSWLELLNRIGYLEYNANLVLLYAQFNSNKINHIDIKQAMSLDKKTVLELFLQSVNYPTQYFDFCLNLGTTNFIQYGLRKCVTQHNELINT